MPPPPTHFLCIPLVTRASRHQLSTSIASFKADITSPDSFGIPEKAVRPIGTLHLTLGVMHFPKDEGLEKAVALLKTILPAQILADVRAATKKVTPGSGQQLDRRSQDKAAMPETKATPGPVGPLLSMTLKGLHAMQSASKTGVLYTSPVDDDGTLFRFCEKLKSTFQEAGLMAEENRPLLLHATILNTIYVKGRKNTKGKRDRLMIDARGIVDRYDGQVWMEDVPVEKIAICKMGAKKGEDGDEAYEVEAEIDLT